MLRGYRKCLPSAQLTIDNKERISAPISWESMTSDIDVIYDNNDTLIYCIVQTDGHFDRFAEFGITLNSKIENYYTCALSFEQIDALLNQKEIVRIEPGRVLRLTNSCPNR